MHVATFDRDQHNTKLERLTAEYQSKYKVLQSEREEEKAEVERQTARQLRVHQGNIIYYTSSRILYAMNVYSISFI